MFLIMEIYVFVDENEVVEVGREGGREGGMEEIDVIISYSRGIHPNPLPRTS